MWKKRRLDACVGHHWHVTGRGWSCCHCAGRVSARRPAPEGDPAMRCVDLAPPTSGLRKWLSRLAPTTPAPRRRPLALPAGPSAEPPAAGVPTGAAPPETGRETGRELERV